MRPNTLSFIVKEFVLFHIIVWISYKYTVHVIFKNMSPVYTTRYNWYPYPILLVFSSVNEAMVSHKSDTLGSIQSCNNYTSIAISQMPHTLPQSVLLANHQDRCNTCDYFSISTYHCHTLLVLPSHYLKMCIYQLSYCQVTRKAVHQLYSWWTYIALHETHPYLRQQLKNH